MITIIQSFVKLRHRTGIVLYCIVQMSDVCKYQLKLV